MFYKGYEIITDTDFCGEKTVYVLDGEREVVQVTSAKEARQMIDNMLRDLREYDRGNPGD